MVDQPTTSGADIPRPGGDGAGEANASATDALDTVRLDAVARSVSNLTHDLNNTLMGLQNYAELSTIPSVQRSAQAHHAARMIDLVADAQRAIGVLRRVALGGRGEAEPCDLESLVHDAVLASRAGLRRDGIVVEAPLGELPSRIVVVRGDALVGLLALLEVARQRVASSATNSPEARVVLFRVARPVAGPTVDLFILCPACSEASPHESQIERREEDAAALLARAGAELDPATDVPKSDGFWTIRFRTPSGAGLP